MRENWEKQEEMARRRESIVWEEERLRREEEEEESLLFFHLRIAREIVNGDMVLVLLCLLTSRIC